VLKIDDKIPAKSGIFKKSPVKFFDNGFFSGKFL